jgi:hypothetical protein
MPIEGREDDVIVLTVIKRFASYNEHDVAAFLPEQAQKLIDDGFAVEGGGVDDPPVNLHEPHAVQEGDQLTCTMGEWAGEPSGYAYQWQADGVDIATGTPYPLTVADVGKTFTCLVTATNDAGSTAAPPSNEVVVVEPPAGEELAAAPSHRRRRN